MAVTFRATGPRTGRPRTARQQYRQQRRTIHVAYFALVMAALFILQVMRIYGPPFGAALAVLLAVVGIAMVRPAVAFGIVITLSIVGDARSMAWWPVVKNLSSAESILYVADGVTISPFEIVLVAVLVIWLVSRQFEENPPPIVRGPFWWPLVAFSISLVFGLLWGLSQGGDLRVAMFEIRPLASIPLVYLLATNLLTSLRHYHNLAWGVVAALTVESVHGWAQLSTLRKTLPSDLSTLEHTAALHMNILFLLLIASWVFGSGRIGKRPVLLLLTIPTIFMYLDSQRRAAVVGLIIGIAYLAAILYSRNRARFRKLVPVMSLIGVAYLALFWGATDNPAGFPAQAVKIIVEPGAAGEQDVSSDLYRVVENFDLSATIRSSPITGIGFGKPFLRPIELPDISFFEFWEYIPHNSVLWVWTQVGIVGFVAFLYLFGIGTATGVRAARRMEDRDDAALVAVFAAFIPMTLIVAFVDITLDTQTMALFAIALALVGSAERLREQAETPPRRQGSPPPQRGAARHP